MQNPIIELEPEEALAERFRPYVENEGLMHYRNRATTNTANQTDDQTVHSFMQQDDEASLLESVKLRFRDEKK